MALKVLLADDSMTAQNMGKKILADAGFEVATVSNGAAAIKKVAEYKPNIIILDIYMPGYTGLEVCERVRATDSTVPILLTVGKLEPFRQEDVDHVRADAIIVKPFEATDLINTVQKFADQADLAASKAAVPPPEPVVELPPPPPPAQLSDDDLAFLRGDLMEQATPEPEVAASNAGHAAAASPDFADLLAAPQTPVSYSEPSISLNDFELPPLTHEDFEMVPEIPASPTPAPAETPAFVSPEIDLPAPQSVQASAIAPQNEVAAEPPAPEMPVFQLDESVTAAQGEVPALSVYDATPVIAPEPEHVVDIQVPATESAPLAEAAMAAIPVFEPAHEMQPQPAFLPEPVFATETSYLPAPELAPELEVPAPDFGLELSTELAASAVAEPFIEPILETAPAAVVEDVAAAPELEPLELEQSGPQPTSDVVAAEPDLAPAFEFIGATGITPADAEIEAVTALPITAFESEPAHETLAQEAILDATAAAVPVVATAAISENEPAPELATSEPATTSQPAEPVAAMDLNLNYATVAGVVHRVFDRYKSQMIADIVRELSKQK